ncbi:MAG: DUF1559 domain-containing protein [Planctomycetaceae bacterium]|nr:DUF1559 domain-containing protein [Planctomycetaceae bacterium]
MSAPQSPLTSEAVPQRLHLFPAALSLVCPGLGQLVQGRPMFLCHMITWVLVVITWIPFFSLLLKIWSEIPEHFAQPLLVVGTEDMFILFLLVLFTLSYLLPVLFVLFTVFDAATWKQGIPSPFKKRFSILFCLLIPLSAFYGFATPAFHTAREAARRMKCCGRMNQLHCAFHNYHDVHGSFPPAYTVDEDGKALHSWRVLILPFIEQKELYEKIRLDEPWDSEYNRQFHEVQIEAYQCPTRRSASSPHIHSVFIGNNDILRRANCDYSVVIGEETIFPPGSRTVTLDDIANYPKNTILIAERMLPINWMYPNNEVRIEAARNGINRNLFGIGSEHPGGAIVSFAHGPGYEFLPNDFENIKPLLTKSAGD